MTGKLFDCLILRLRTSALFADAALRLYIMLLLIGNLEKVRTY